MAFLSLSFWYHWINPPTKYLVINTETYIKAVKFGHTAANNGETWEKTEKLAREKIKNWGVK